MHSRTPLSPGRFFLVWLMIGAQSFGGGNASLVLIRRAAVEEYGWITEGEFVRDWALVQLAPGINLLGLIILIGRQYGGGLGVALALGGLLIPSAIVTTLLTALYTHFAELPVVQAALRGVLPATVGLGFLSAFQMLRPLIKQSVAESRTSLIVSLILLVGCAAITACWQHIPVVLLLCGSGFLCAVYRWTESARGEVDAAAPPTVEEGDAA